MDPRIGESSADEVGLKPEEGPSSHRDPHALEEKESDTGPPPPEASGQDPSVFVGESPNNREGREVVGVQVEREGLVGILKSVGMLVRDSLEGRVEIAISLEAEIVYSAASVDVAVQKEIRAADPPVAHG